MGKPKNRTSRLYEGINVNPEQAEMESDSIKEGENLGIEALLVNVVKRLAAGDYLNEVGLYVEADDHNALVEQLKTNFEGIKTYLDKLRVQGDGLQDQITEQDNKYASQIGALKTDLATQGVKYDQAVEFIGALAGAITTLEQTVSWPGEVNTLPDYGFDKMPDPKGRDASGV